ncbi:MAG: YjjG family noncanonical pyrimidine nucleotidase [Prolixibacteraceae bacterium]|nr:YjjG family noncanonical pyrimidine nucleotidase [Prolixibacteraceae bacterium]
MTKKRYTHLFFDLDHTLWDFKTNSFHALKFAYRKFGIDRQYVDYESFFRIFTNYNDLLWEDYRNQKLNKEELKRLRFQQTFDELSIRGVDPIEMNDLYLDEIPLQKALVSGAEDLLEYLKSKGYMMYIITNGFREVQHIKLNKSGLQKYFAKVFISEDIKTPKPNFEIFEYAVKSSNAPKIKSLMIGDDWETDIVGAVNFGIDAVFLDVGKNNEKSETLNAKFKKNRIYFISKLSELKDIL